MAFNPGGGITQGGGNSPGELGLKVVPHSAVFPITNSNEEVMVSIPACVSYMLQSRNSSRLFLSYSAAGTGSNYLTIWPGACYSESYLISAARTLYLLSSKPNDTIEVIYWTST